MVEKTMEFHPIAEIFPLMEGTAFHGLVKDIQEHGLRAPILLHSDGRLIDGRNRYRACREAGVEPRFETWDGSGSPLKAILSFNVYRRHLDESQRAMVAARLANIEHGGGRSKMQICTLITLEEAAKMLNVSRRSVASAKQVLDSGSEELIHAVDQAIMPVSQAAQLVGAKPELISKVIQKLVDGDAMTATEAIRQIKHEDRPAVTGPAGKYRVIYADPPWSYGNSNLQNYGHASFHYPPMSIEELCALKIADISETDAVLFLWTTSPLFPESVQVIDAWGYTYKTSFVWDKVKHNFGHYNSVRHEFLLVCTRGSCMPDVKTLHDSVVSVERSGKHSEKPEEFRKIIDEIYPHGNRIELFARAEHDGWERWGNE